MFETEVTNRTENEANNNYSHQRSNFLRLLQLPESTYDAVTLSLVLCYLPTPEMRIKMIRQARRLLISELPQNDFVEQLSIAHKEPLSHFQSTCRDTVNSINISSPLATVIAPHKSGLLVIFEKQSIFPTGNYVEYFMKNWKECICAEGFEFIKHESIVYGNRKSHGFVFKAVSMVKSLAPVTAFTSYGPVLTANDVDVDVRPHIFTNGLWIKSDLYHSETQYLKRRSAVKLNGTSPKNTEELI